LHLPGLLRLLIASLGGVRMAACSLAYIGVLEFFRCQVDDKIFGDGRHLREDHGQHVFDHPEFRLLDADFFFEGNFQRFFSSLCWLGESGQPVAF